MSSETQLCFEQLLTAYFPSCEGTFCHSFHRLSLSILDLYCLSWAVTWMKSQEKLLPLPVKPTTSIEGTMEMRNERWKEFSALWRPRYCQAVPKVAWKNECVHVYEKLGMLLSIKSPVRNWHKAWTEPCFPSHLICLPQYLLCSILWPPWAVHPSLLPQHW